MPVGSPEEALDRACDLYISIRASWLKPWTT
jgi:hypothetical protein